MKKSQGSNIKPVPLKLRRGCINWEPPFPEGEDELSLKWHSVCRVKPIDIQTRTSRKANGAYLSRSKEAHEPKSWATQIEDPVPCFFQLPKGTYFWSCSSVKLPILNITIVLLQYILSIFFKETALIVWLHWLHAYFCDTYMHGKSTGSWKLLPGLLLLDIIMLVFICFHEW